MIWELSSSSDPRALAVLDGTGAWSLFDEPVSPIGPHYSRRTPGSSTFTGVGQEIVLVSRCGRAVWACVYQKTPTARGTGASRGRDGVEDDRVRFLWRNNVFRNLGAGLSSYLIREAVKLTRIEWLNRYGRLPVERLRTEVDIKAVRSPNPGYCYRMAGWERGAQRGSKLIWWAPQSESAYPALIPNLARPYPSSAPEPI